MYVCMRERKIDVREKKITKKKRGGKWEWIGAILPVSERKRALSG